MDRCHCEVCQVGESEKLLIARSAGLWGHGPFCPWGRVLCVMGALGPASQVKGAQFLLSGVCSAKTCGDAQGVIKCPCLALLVKGGKMVLNYMSANRAERINKLFIYRGYCVQLKLVSKTDLRNPTLPEKCAADRFKFVGLGEWS